MNFVHVDQDANTNNVVESKQYQQFARIEIVKNGKKQELDTF